MAFWQKQKANPIDRAVEDLEKQIATLQRQLRTAETGGKPQSPVAAKAESVTKLVKELLTPPPKKEARAARKSRRDLFDATAEPLKDLEAEPIVFTQPPAPDLFAHATPGQRIDCAPKPEEKLAIYISAGSLKGFKRPLRVEQRRNRNRFLMWIGLGFVALWFIWAVVR
jgi:hypothetical protein